MTLSRCLARGRVIYTRGHRSSTAPHLGGVSGSLSNRRLMDGRASLAFLKRFPSDHYGRVHTLARPLIPPLLSWSFANASSWGWREWEAGQARTELGCAAATQTANTRGRLPHPYNILSYRCLLYATPQAPDVGNQHDPTQARNAAAAVDGSSHHAQLPQRPTGAPCGRSKEHAPPGGPSRWPRRRPNPPTRPRRHPSHRPPTSQHPPLPNRRPTPPMGCHSQRHGLVPAQSHPPVPTGSPPPPRHVINPPCLCALPRIQRNSFVSNITMKHSSIALR